MKEKTYKRKTEHMVAFWLRKLANEHKAKEATAKIRKDGVCVYEIYREDGSVGIGLVFSKKNTKPKKLVFEVDGKTLKYKSIRKAAEGLGVARPTLTNIVNGHTKRSFALESAGIKFVGEE